MVMSPDGRELDYNYLSSLRTESEGKFRIEETWIDAEGNQWYKGRGIWTDTDTKKQDPWYFLYKVNAAGAVLEAVWSPVGYPSEMGPLGGFYGTWNKQD
jgi:hypothetical protein